MNHEKLNVMSSALATLQNDAGSHEQLDVKGVFTIECKDVDGNVLWAEKFKNLVTTAGKNYLLDNFLAGASFTPAFYLGLYGATGFVSAPVIGDTMASHVGWAEAGGTNAPAYGQANRPSASPWNAASGGVKALTTPLTFSIVSAGTLKGALLSTNSTKDGTTGTLFSAGAFQGGDQPVAATNTVTVSYQLGV
jgi:hypothetical protein